MNNEAAITTTDSENSGLTILAVHIDCNPLKGEITSVIRHEPVSFRIGDASENRTDERVTIEQRTFKAYGRSPGIATERLAQSMFAMALRTFPGVPVQLYGA